MTEPSLTPLVSASPPEFAASALPLTMGIARRYRRVIRSQTAHLPASWPFEDRVLAWLVPHLEREVVYFHANRGKPLSDLYLPHQIAHLDEDFCLLLKRRLVDIDVAWRSTA